MSKYYDKKNRRLILMEESPTEKFWEKHWLDPKDFEKRVKNGVAFGIVKKYTTRFLKKESKVIDAGCGIGQNVLGLKEWGYDAYGVDFTEEVIKKTKNTFPNLKIYTQDVKKLDFPNDFFDGYWSLGVIEHFLNGYDDIIDEARRVIKNDGYLFLTVPWFSPLRRLKAWVNIYPKFNEGISMANFYEYMLDDKIITKIIEDKGFTLISRHPNDAVKGLKDEIYFLRPILQKIYASHSLFYRFLRGLITIFFAPFAGHIILLVFKKHENNI